MLGIERKYLEPIHSVAKQLNPNYNPEKLGDWGILFLCCGAFAASNRIWQNRVCESDIFVCQSDLDKILQGSEVCTSDDYAERFSEYIKKWSNESYAIAVIDRRLEHSKDNMSDKAFHSYKIYLTLAFMLNSLQDLPREKLLEFDCQKWVSMSNGKEQNYGWPELFFAAGLLLNNEESVGWHKMASTIHGIGKSNKVDVAKLYEHYAGRNPFLNSAERKKIRTDEIKKGMRVRMRNGWEAVIVKEGKGNTLTAKVFGDFTETGNIYAHDIVAAEVNGKWIEVGMSEEQFRLHKEVSAFFNESSLKTREKEVSSYEAYNNNVPKGEAPRILETHVRHPRPDERGLRGSGAVRGRDLAEVGEKEGTAEPEVTPPAYGSQNKLIDETTYKQSVAELKKRLSGIHMGVSHDQELMQDGAYAAGFVIEGGARKFMDYASKMIEILGDAIRPYLKSYYMAVKYQPGLDSTGMDNQAELDKIDVDTIDITKKMI